MPDYDFSGLNDKEFELLSIDLLSCHLHCHIERFKSGRDGGVDGRFFSDEGHEIVVQCKHWLKSGLDALIRSVERTEADKVRNLNPKRYIFVTSLELSRSNKLRVKKLFSPFILTESDVLGNEDLNDILSKNPEVEKKHYKLWIASTNVLQMILSSAVIGRSKNKLEEIVEESSRYVITQNHTRAMAILERIHSIIITGSPGVGKTSLADQLCQYYVANGYEFCFIENSLNEAEQIYNETAKQVFYFDDFLGRNFILALTAHQDSHVINFIKRVERDKKKRFILTTRSNILNQGKRLSELFDIKHVDRNEYELSVSDLSAIDKAKILYNHLWFGQLEDIYVDELYVDSRYISIINHKNFNPRLISFITDSHRLSDISPGSYWDYVEDTLSNPKDIWRHVLEVQMDSISKNMVVSVVLHGQAISEEKLKETYQKLISISPVTAVNNYDSTIRLLVGALLNRTVISSGAVRYDLFDPSIADFVIANYFDDFDYVDELLDCLRTKKSVENINSLLVSDVMGHAFYCRLLDSQLIRLSMQKDGARVDSYRLKILVLSLDRLSKFDEIQDYIARLANSTLDSGCCDFGVDYFEFISWLVRMGVIEKDDKRLLRGLRDWIENNVTSIIECIPLSRVVACLDTPPSSLTSLLKIRCIELLSEDITKDVISVGMLGDILYIESFDASDLSEYIENRVSKLAISFDNDDIEAIVESCDMEEVINSNRDAMLEEDYRSEALRDYGNQTSASAIAIHDLFDRG